MKHEHPQRQVLALQCFKCKVCNQSLNTLKNHIYCIHAPGLNLGIPCRTLLIKTIQIDFVNKGKASYVLYAPNFSHSKMISKNIEDEA